MNALPRHHLDEDTLIAYAAGTLAPAASVMVASHLTLCPGCRNALAAAEAVGGALLECESTAAMQTSAEALLARAEAVPQTRKPSRPVNDNRDEALLPRPVRDLIADAEPLNWRWMGPGVRYAFLAGDEKEGKVGLLKIAPGTRLPKHGHTGEEFTMVLAGGYADEGGHFVRGDVEWADGATVHQPHADADGECLCLVVTKGTLKAKGFLAPFIQPLMAI